MKIEYDHISKATYADEGISGTNTKKRDEFNHMIADCRAGKIDMIITKSISRFARNTLDCLNYVRELKDLGIEIIFEKENINTLDAKGEVFLTILSSLVQDDSRSISENSTWGIRRKFEQGKHKMSTKRFLGYDADEEGHPIVNKQQAKNVVRLYEEFLSGKTVDYIARIFKAEKIRNWDGKYNWHASTLDSMLRNEKCMGDTILQKGYTADFLSKRCVVNDGDLPKYYIKRDHEPIIDIETWEAVQAELGRRAQYCTEHFTNAYSQKTETNHFYAKIICGNCGSTYSRVKYTTRAGTAITKWHCGSCNKTNGHKVCSNRCVLDETLTKLFVMSWNEIVDHQADYQERWQENIRGDDVLLRYKTRLVIQHAVAGPIKEFDLKLMLAVMDHITVFEVGRFQIKFYDETEFEVETEK